jgi:hypothetical protein
MGDGDPPQHLRELPITSRPEQEVPVIRHQAIGGDAYPGLVVGFSENLLKRSVVSWLLKQRESSDTTVQDMIGEVSSSEARAAWHVPSLPKLHELVKKRLPTPFFLIGDYSGLLEATETV